MVPTPFTRTTCAISLSLLSLTVACGGPSNQLLIKDVPNGVVTLAAFTQRGATGRFLGAAQSARASHPAVVDQDVMVRILSGIRIGIIPAEADSAPRAIKPSPLFSQSEAAALAPAIVNALLQADSSHYVKFRLGSEQEATAGSLFVDGPVMRFTITHYRSTLRDRDESLPIYVLLFTPESAQASAASAPNWMESETSGTPRLAVEYGRLAADHAAKGASPVPTTSAKPSPTQPQNLDDMKATMDRQAQELESMKAELETLKKQLGEPRLQKNTTAPHNQSP